ncbi:MULTISPECIES: transcriptional regulator NosR [Halomonadaceae]|jgi:NosR/NirI family transcriptional regulator, nitrous oxide reductase regulator|uniref:transcriptional regulator NosR n=1 Tax=Halomonadaceae TaxID=28256 RepID=UPI0012F2B58A|nr:MULTISPECIES: NosR/NirI family protein [Halomonas]CAD5259365.1 Regulatory protein NosR [Halomonas sp. 156]CAD5289581.1 Regulatory protein NosR [Halomonas sp. 113]CAD5291076.1 Regulatory protein NosR [Halomonas sp. 59]CAD5294931.1 Regulatory protein NosR [Halomonas sp. I3]VXB50592.1 Regulatory protein NosR [Halomonas titanicae]
MSPVAYPRRLTGIWISLLLLLAITLPAQAIELEQVREGFPTAEHLEAADSQWPVSRVLASDDELLGYAFESVDVAPIPAYSGKPVNVLVGIGLDGQIVQADVLSHSEPIMLVGIPESKLNSFADEHESAHVNDRLRVGDNLDAISGATVTVIVVSDTIMRSARQVAAEQQLIADPSQTPPARVREDVFAPANWDELTGDGTIRRLQLTHGEVDTSFIGTPAEDYLRSPQPADKTFIELFYTYLNPPTAGRNLLGDTGYDQLMVELKDGEHAIAVMGRGDYSFKGSGYVRGGIFDRIELSQGSTRVSFHDRDHIRLGDLALEGAPTLAERDIFIVREETGFDPGQPWQLELLVRRASGPLDTEFSRFSADYSVPEAYVERPEPPVEEPIWVQVWRDKAFQIAVLSAGLLVLTGIMLFQDMLARHPRVLNPLRLGFKIYTLVFIGWYSLAQLSVVNILTFTNSLISGFSWSSFLIDPMLFILWSFVAVSLLLWGRGVFCGWLCPFGALQDLVNQVARKLNVKQIEVPFGLHERLWAIKYIILLALFAVSLHSLGTAERYAEVEPFKTAITLRFQRDWAFVIYALGLVAISAFNHKFYCRYLCPLGAGLAIPSRLRLFDWLKRHRGSCGTPCQICANECEVAAIHPDGRINANECHYCLDCQVTYHDDQRCPPMVKRRKRYEKAANMSSRGNSVETQRDTDASGKQAAWQRIPLHQQD